MDFLDPKKRKNYQIRLYIGYALMAVLVGMVSILMLFQAYGYTFNVETGNINQNSLLFVDAKPLPAQLYVDDELKGETDQRLILPEGNYSLRLAREGYHDWNRNVTLRGGVIHRYLHPFLFPVNLETTEAELYSTKPAFSSQSPSRQWLLTQIPGSITDYSLTDLNQELPVSTRFKLPEAVLTTAGSKHEFNLIEWSNDNEHLVVKHVHDAGSEFILIDTREPQNSVNLTTSLPLEFTDLRLRDKLADSYYLYSNKTKVLSRADLDSEQAEPVLEAVLAFHPHGDNEMLYVTNKEAAKGEVSVMMLEDGESFKLKPLPAGERYLLDIARYDSKWYMAMYSSSDDRMYILRDPVSFLRRDREAVVIPAGILRIENAQHVSFSQNTRFISAQAGQNLAVYDAEEDAIYRYDAGFSPVAGQQFVWMDGHRLTAVDNDTQVVFDYDGLNQRRLAHAYSQSQSYFDRDYTAAYTIAPSEAVDGRAALLRTELIVEEQ